MTSIQPTTRPIGVFDSGIGGLSVLEAIRRRLPHENMLYVADNYHAPYGEKSAEWILNRSQKISQFLVEQGAKAIVIACNTATAAAVSQLRAQIKVPIIGLEPAIKPAAELSRTGKVGVLATPSTLKSEKYRLLKSRFSDSVNFVEVASSKLVEIVESGEAYSEYNMQQIATIIRPMIDAEVDVLVLGCTHFPFLEKQLRQLMGKSVVFLDSAAPVAAELARQISNELNGSLQAGESRFYASAPEKIQQHINAVNGRPLHLEQLPSL